MPNAAKPFRLHNSPNAKSTGKRVSACKAGYDRAWQRFREWFASVVPPICGAKLNGTETKFSCGKSFPSRQMQLDHLKPFDTVDDPLRLDAENLAWRCQSCHSKKTASKDGGFGNGG